MSIKTRKTWLAVGLTTVLASGAPGFVAPSMMTSAYAQSQKITLFSFNTPDFTVKKVSFDSESAYREIESDSRVHTHIR